MNKYLALAILLLPALTNAEEWRQFHIESDSWFSVHSTGYGRILVNDGSVTINIQKAELVGSNNINGSHTVTNIRAGIAYYIDKSNDAWLVSSLSQPQQVNTEISNGKTITVKPFTVTLDVPNSVINDEHWVVLQIDLKNNEGKTAYGFSHESDNN